MNRHIVLLFCGIVIGAVVLILLRTVTVAAAPAVLLGGVGLVYTGDLCFGLIFRRSRKKDPDE